MSEDSSNAELARSHEKVREFAAFLKESGRQPSTVDSYARDARSFSSYLHASGLSLGQVQSDTLVHFEEFLRHEKHERENSVRRSVIGVRLFYRFLMGAGGQRTSPFDEVPIPQRQEELPKELAGMNWEALVAAAKGNASPLRASRNLCILLLLAREGIKATEMIELEWKDVLEFESGSSLQIHGPRKRAVVLGEESHQALDSYKKNLADTIGVVGSDSLAKQGMRILVAFQGRDGGTLLPKMTRHGLKFIIYEIGEKLGLPHLNSEVLRHYAVTHLLSEGKSVEEIKVHLGLRRAGNIAKHMEAQSSSVPVTSSELGRSPRPMGPLPATSEI